MEEFVGLIAKYGLDTVVIALITVVLTGVAKIPVKALAARLKRGSILRKIIVFMPLAFSFAVTAVYSLAACGGVCFEKPFFTLWLSAASASLALYAVWEKLFPSGKKPVSEKAVAENLNEIEKLGEAFGVDVSDLNGSEDDENVRK